VRWLPEKRNEKNAVKVTSQD